MNYMYSGDIGLNNELHVYWCHRLNNELHVKWWHRLNNELHV